VRLDLSKLPPILRVLLVTDGTVTRILEAHFQEQIEIRILKHEERVSEGVPRLEREVLLLGRQSGKVFAFAQTVAPLNALSEELRRALMSGRQGVGELLLEHRLETFREVTHTSLGEAGIRAKELRVNPKDPVVERKYSIHLHGREAFQISEVFPLRNFVE
jgi:chorismate-pyruvate lyase